MSLQSGVPVSEILLEVDLVGFSPEESICVGLNLVAVHGLFDVIE